MTATTRQALPWLVWIAVLAVVSLSLEGARSEVETGHVISLYLLVVLGGSATGGRILGFTLAIACFLLLNYYFQAPYNTLAVGKQHDWVVLLAFLITAGVATHLLTRAREEAAEARRHADEVERLSRVAEHAEALREASRLKDILLASVSHDLRTPLTTIKALAEDVAKGGDTRAAEIGVQADRLSHMVGDLLDLSRIRAGALPIHAEINTAEDLVGALARQFAAVSRGRITTIVDLSQPALVGRFDFVQSLRILNNLVENALRYSPESDQVELSVGREGAHLVFRVADRGRGVDPAERDRVFDAFYRPADMAPETGRAGLGLSIARNLAELQGGTLTYEPRDGGGSEFLLRLPAADVSAEPGQSS